MQKSVRRRLGAPLALVVLVGIGCGTAGGSDGAPVDVEGSGVGRLTFNADVLPTGYSSTPGESGAELVDPPDGLVGEATIGTLTTPDGDRVVGLRGIRDLVETWSGGGSAGGDATSFGVDHGVRTALDCPTSDDASGSDICGLVIASADVDEASLPILAASLRVEEVTLEDEEDARALLGGTPSQTLVAQGTEGADVWVSLAQGDLPVAVSSLPGATEETTPEGDRSVRWNLGGRAVVFVGDDDWLLVSVALDPSVPADAVADVAGAAEVVG